MRSLRMALLLGLAVAACGKSTSGQAVAEKVNVPPLKLEWLGQQGNSLVLRGADLYDRYERLDLELDVSGAEPAWVFRGSGFTAGSTIVVGEARAEAKADRKLELRIPAALGALPLEGLVQEGGLVDPHLALELTPAGEPAQALSWPPTDCRLALLGWIEQQARAGKPLPFGGAPTPASPPTTLVPQRPALAAGPGKTLADVDQIAVYGEASRPKVCKGYTGGVHTKPIDIPVDLEEHRVEVRDRRSGAVVRTGSVSASFDCPAKITTDMYRPGVRIPMGAATMRAWLENP